MFRAKNEICHTPRRVAIPLESFQTFNLIKMYLNPKYNPKYNLNPNLNDV